MGFIKIKNFRLGRDSVKRMKTQATYWEKIIARCISDKGLVSKICKEHSKLNSENQKNPIRKWAEDMKRHFTKEDIQMANNDVGHH